ncbi:MAG: hypothetical protein GC179_29860 [Anaerolineaceae bacterium]|nr:hypothetical protein [Anaerolineaceae bacterium]
MSDPRQIADIIQKRFLDAGGVIYIPVYPYSYDLEIDLIGKLKGHCYFIALRDNTFESMTNAMVQLYEARYRENLEVSTLIIALPDAIADSQYWLKDYFENDRDIKILWLEDNELQATKETQKSLKFLWLQKFASKK